MEVKVKDRRLTFRAQQEMEKQRLLLTPSSFKTPSTTLRRSTTLTAQGKLGASTIRKDHNNRLAGDHSLRRCCFSRDSSGYKIFIVPGTVFTRFSARSSPPLSSPDGLASASELIHS